ncbi:MAG: acyclic terpene utilization AtuA family protein, partial [Caldimonas sp.]
AGADIVITGRCVDSAVTLGVLMHAFEWRADEHDKLAMGSLAGHIIECGCQATGGLHTDWRDVPDWAGIGYPIVEAAPDGTFVVTKPEGSGGLVSVPVVGEQMLYEVGDPARYILPDVVCDFSEVTLEQVGANRVAVRGARGLPPTDTYKVCATYPEGFRAVAQLTIVGFEAVAKCERTAQAILERTRHLFREAGYADYSDSLIEVLGAESGHGPHASHSPIHEAVLRLAVAHADKRALELFAREVAPAGTSWSPGTTGVGGRASPSRVLKQYSFLLAKTRVLVRVVIDGQAMEVAIPAGHALAPRELPASTETPAAIDTNGITVPLIALAWARSGDKGDSCNVGVIARSPALVEYLRDALTAERVRAYLAHLVKGKVTRYDVPGIGAFNFLLEEALGGGGMASLRNDPWGKGMAQILLTMPMHLAAHLVPGAAYGNARR